MFRSFGLSAFLSLLLGIACSPTHTQHTTLSEETFVHLFTEMAVLTYTYVSEPEQLETAYEQVMQKYKLSEEDLAEALLSFEKNPERWTSMVEGIAKELERLSHEGVI